MPQRFLRPGITTSDSWNSCSYEGQSLYIRLITVVDDYGRYDGRSAVILGHCFALRPDMTSSKTAELLSELQENGLIRLYTVFRKDFVQVEKWQERARGTSKYPPPPGMEKEEKTLGKIYFIQGDISKRIKIGFTKWEVEARANRLQTGSSEHLTVLFQFEGTLREERSIHRQFSCLNCGGEWFNFHADIVAFASNRSKCVQSAGSPRPKLLPSPSPSPSPSPPSLVGLAPDEGQVGEQKEPAEGKRAAKAKCWSPDARVALAHLNEKAGRHFRETDLNLGLIQRRLLEVGGDLPGVRMMIDRMCKRWLGTEQADYLRPETLFGKEKFGGYYDNRDIPVPQNENSKRVNPRNLGTCEVTTDFAARAAMCTPERQREALERKLAAVGNQPVPGPGGT